MDTGSGLLLRRVVLSCWLPAVRFRQLPMAFSLSCPLSLSLSLSLAAGCQLCGSLARRIRASTPSARSRFPVPRERLQDPERGRRRQQRTLGRAPCHFTWTVAPRGATTSAVDSSRDAARATLGQRDRDRTMPSQYPSKRSRHIPLY